MQTIFLAALLSITGTAIAQDAPPPPRGGGMLMRADANNDGVLTREEAIAQATERFDRMDLDRDGKLTREELQQVGQRMRGMRGNDAPPSAQ
ncbi:hypothetical protein [Sphingomonas sp.]|jgi:hypothetical protein|uniref:hypothetical protein n=1 Tax=Sphingomonas sp. TaxID=28214 RepID=UPI002D7FAF97|nr:hypothetical protein [Sphingomonas sp.]HEU0044592.1 hypothetical protein [Sphingomonas sp.]